MRGVLRLRLLAVPVLIVSALGLAPMARAASLSVVGLNPLTTANDTSATASGWADPGATVSLTVSDSGAGTVTGSAVAGDNGSWVITGLNLSGLADGAITYAVVSNSVPASYAATKNAASPPALYISSAPATVNNAAKTSVTVSGVAPAAATVNLTISDGTNTVTDSTTATGGVWSFTKALTGLTDGPITYAVTSGSDTAVAPGLLDTTASVATTTPAAVNASNVSSFSVGGTGENGATISLVISDGSPPNVTATRTVSGGVWSATALDMSGLSDGTLNYSVTATDVYGNTATDPKTGIKDVVAPTVAIVGRTTPINTLNQTSASASGTGEDGTTVNLTVTDAGSAHTVTASGSVSGGAWSITGLNLTSLNDGVNTITYRVTATDAAGNVSGPSSLTATKDTIIPTVAISTRTNPIRIDNVTNVGITGTGQTGCTIELTITDTHSNSVSGSATVAASAWSITGLNASALQDGDTITYTVIARDPAGNPSVSAYSYTTKDTIAPLIAVTAYTHPIKISNVSSASISGTGENGRPVNLTVSDQHGHTVTGSATVSGGNWTITGLNLSGLDDGDVITYTAIIRDAAQNATTALPEPTTTKDTVAPDLAITVSPTIINIANVGAVTVSGTREANLPVTLTVTDTHTKSVVGTDSGSGGTWSITVNLGLLTDGDTITYTASVTDPGENTVTRTATATKDTVAPALAIPTPPTINIANASSVTVSGTGENGRVVTLTVTDQHGHSAPGTSTPTISGGVWSITGIDLSTFSDGDVITYTASVTDPSGNTTTITPSGIKDTVAPTLAIPVPPTINIANASAVTVLGTSDANGRTVTLTVTDTHSHSVPGSATVSGGVWSISGLNLSSFIDGDVITYTASVSDAAGNPTTVNPTGTKDTVAPALAIPTPPTINIANASAVTVLGTSDANGRTVTLTVTDTHSHSVPGSATVSGGVWSISGLNLSTFSDGDVITYTASVTDPSGNTTTITPSGIKDTVAPTLAIPVPPTINIANASAVTVLGTSDANGRTVTLTVTDTHSHSVPGSATVSGGVWSISGLNLSSFIDGDVITYTASVSDAAGNPTTVNPTGTKDTVAPAVAITDGPNLDINIAKVTGVVATGTGETGATVVLTVTDQHSNTISGLTTPVISGGVWSITTANLSTLVDGDVITYHVTATDPSGNPTVAATVTGTKDTVAPAVAITDGPNLDINIAKVTGVVATGTGETGATVVLTVTDQHSNTISGLTTPVISGGVWSITTANLSTLVDGDVITYHVTATDPSGNPTVAATVTGTKDTVAPAVAITSSPTKVNIGNVAGVVVSGTGETGAVVVLTMSDMSAHSVSGLTTPTISGGVWSITAANAGALLDGDVITYSVTATDPAGNPTVSASTFATKDTVAPALAVSFRSNPVNISNVSSASINGTGENGNTIALTVTDQHSNSVSGAASVAVGVWSITGRNLTSLVDGDIITYTVIATEASGNTTQVQVTATKDTVAPALAITTSPAQININNVGSVTVSGTGENGRVVTLTVTDQHSQSIPGTSTPTISGGVWSISGINLSTLTDGDTITFTASVTDPGNNTVTSTATATKDTVAPTLAIVVAPTPINIANVGSITVSGTSDANGRTVNLTVTDTHSHSVPGSATVSGGAWSISGLNLSSLTDGDVITYTATVLDTSQNLTTRTAAAVKDTVINIGISPLPIINAANASAVPISGTADTDIGTVSLVLTDSALNTVSKSGITVSGGAWSTTIDSTALLDGPIAVSVQGVDSHSNMTSQPGSTTKDMSAPSVAIVAWAGPVNILNVTSAAISGTGETGNSVELKVTDGTPAHDVVRTGTVASGAWSFGSLNLSGLTDGTITYSVKVTDPSENTSTVTKEVLKDTVAPTVAIPTPPTINIANASAVTVSGTGENGLVVTLTVTDQHSNSVPGSATISSGSWSATLNLSSFVDGDVITYTASVTDPGLNNVTIAPTGIKDTVAPTLAITVPTINIANASAVVVPGTSNATGRPVTLTVTDEHGHSVAATPNPIVSGGGTWSATLNLSSFIDGDLITYSASVRDSAENLTSIAPTGIKDTVVNIGVNTPPVINIANASAVTISGTADLDVSQVSVTLTGGGSLNQPSVPVVSGLWSTTFNATSLTDGSIAVHVSGLDDVGNPDSDDKTATKDTVAPALAITVPTINIANASAVTVSGTGENGLVVTLTVTDQHFHSVPGTTTPTISGGVWSISGLNLSSFVDGDEITYTASVTDGAENQTTITPKGIKDTVVNIGVNTPPVINIANASAVTISGTADPDVLSVSVTLTGGGSLNQPSVPVVSGLWSTTFNATSLTDGSIAVHVSGLDDVGNPDSDDKTATKDTVAPALAITVPTINIANASAVTVSGTGENGLVVTLTVTDQHFHSVPGTTTPTISGGVWSISGLNLSSFVDGDEITYTASVTDGAENQTTITPKGIKDTVVNIGVNTPPVINIANASAVTISGTADPDVLSVSVTLTGGGSLNQPSVPVVSGLWSTTFNATSLTDGSIAVHVSGLDDVGNPDSDDKTATKDTVVNIGVNTPPTINSANVSSVLISGTADPDVLSVSVTLTGGGSLNQPSVPVVSGLWSTSFDATSLSQGSIAVHVSGSDGAGNPDSDDKTTVKDTIPPAVVISSYTNPIDYDNAPGAVISGTGENGATIHLTVTDQHFNSVPGNTAPVVSGGVWTITANLTTLLDGDVITYSVVATDARGNSSAEVIAYATKYTGPVAPDAPTGVAGAPGPARVTVSWIIPADDGRSPITGYTVTTVGNPTKTCTASGPTATSCVVLLLTAGTSYTFTVTATNAMGTSVPSSPSAPVVPNPADPPDKPTDATGFGLNTAARISWTAPVYTGGVPIISYTVTSAPGGRTCTWTSGPLSCTVTGLTNRTGYKFTVTATNSVGTSVPSDASKTIIPREGHSYVALTPNRIFSTSQGIQRSTKLSARESVTFQVTNQFPADATRNVPSTATAVTGVLSFSGQTSKGWGGVEPVATGSVSSINFANDDPIASGVTVTLGAGGTLALTYGAATGNLADAAFDVTGYFTEGTGGATYVSLTPARVLDSRPTCCGHTNAGLTGKFTTGVSRTFQVSGRGGVPSWAIAVTGNVTLTGQSSAGRVAVGPDATASPTTVTVLSPTGDNRATSITTKLGTDGTLSAIWIGTSGSTADLIFDVNGYFVAGVSGAMYMPVVPNRVLNTRETDPTKTALIGKIYSHVGVAFWVVNRSPGDSTKNVPSTAVAVTGTLTVTAQEALGWFSLTTTAQNNPTTSTLNFLAASNPKGGDRATGVTVPLGAGKLGLCYGATPGKRSHAVFDVTGYFLP